MINVVLTVITAGMLVFSSPADTNIKPLSHVTYSLSNRYTDTFVNEVFSDNILLTLAYMDGKVKQSGNVPWDIVKKPSVTKLVLEPGQTFAFHDAVSEKYKGKIAATTNAYFSSDYGFKSDGWLVGDGVCHLASFMYVAALKAGLEAEAPTRHDFAKIENVPKKYGVSIFYTPNDPSGSSVQNLYITNNKSKTIAFIFEHKKNYLDIQVQELN